jgi:hypothetical protein
VVGRLGRVVVIRSNDGAADALEETGLAILAAEDEIVVAARG